MLKYCSVLAIAAVLLGVNSSARAEEFPTGTYSAKMVEDKWSIKFEDKGKYTVKLKDEVVVEGSYTTSKDEIEFKNEKGKRADPANKVGKYKWKLDGKKITFTKIEDQSEGRAAALTTGMWTKE